MKNYRDKLVPCSCCEGRGKIENDFYLEQSGMTRALIVDIISTQEIDLTSLESRAKYAYNILYFAYWELYNSNSASGADLIFKMRERVRDTFELDKERK